MNKVILTGNVGKAIEAKETANGNVYANFALGVEGYKGATDWIYVTAWGKVAQALTQYTNVGDKLTVEGSVTVNAYTDANGNKVMRQNITVRSFDRIALGKASREQVAARAAENKDYEEVTDTAESPF